MSGYLIGLLGMEEWFSERGNELSQGKTKDVDRADRFLCRSSAVPAGGRGRIVSGDGVFICMSVWQLSCGLAC